MNGFSLLVVCALVTAACGQSSTTLPAGTNTCGNGKLDGTETCDPAIAEGRGACPTSCDDADPCTRDLLEGAGSACSVTCTHPPVTACAGGDGCCPTDCDGSSDAECPGCADECPVAGAVRCEQNAVATCGNFDADSCREWGSATSCPGTQTCTNGVCLGNSPPGKVLINEVVYDSAGAPDSKAFVELHGPAGLSLTGFKLVGVAGERLVGILGAGEVYNALPLVGSIGPDGYFVVAHTRAPAALRAQADQLDNSADYLDGPDSIQLRWGETVVDAIGHGTFGTSSVFAGEGRPAVAVAVDHSLGRDAQHTDTDDNSVDFEDSATPTPGASNAAPTATCGNGVVEAGETCDGHCPTGCGDANACTTDAATGSAATCNATCANQPITQCTSGDGCCAPGCSSAADDDCRGIQCNGATPRIVAPGVNVQDQWFVWTGGGLSALLPGVAQVRPCGLLIDDDSTLFPAVDVRGGGPNWGLSYIPSTPIHAWSNGGEPAFEGDVNVVSIRQGAASTVFQAGFIHYVHGKTTTGVDVTLAHTVQLYDSRPAYADPEYIGNDTYTDFVSARAVATSRYVTLRPNSAVLRVGPAWNRTEHHAYSIPWAKMLNVIDEIEAQGRPPLSRNPGDWVISSISLAGEMTPPKTDGGFKTDVSNLRLFDVGTPGASCSFAGQTVASGQTVSAYAQPSVPSGSACRSEQRTCLGGTLSGSFPHASCSGPCSFDGQSIAPGQSITAHEKLSVPFGSVCRSEQRACTGGTLSGSFPHASCLVQEAAHARTWDGAMTPIVNQAESLGMTVIPNHGTTVPQDRLQVLTRNIGDLFQGWSTITSANSGAITGSGTTRMVINTLELSQRGLYSAASGDGPHIWVSKNPSAGVRPWLHSNRELVLQSNVQVPLVQLTDPTGAQASSGFSTSQAPVTKLFFGLDLVDDSTGKTLTFKICMYESQGTYTEFIANDTNALLVSSPLEEGIRYATKSPFSASLRSQPFTEETFFRVHLTAENLLNAIREENRRSVGLSENLSDYRIGQLGVLFELPNHVQNGHNTSMANVSWFSAYSFAY